MDLKQLEMLRARALRREEELKAAEALAAKEEALVCKGFFREPIKFTTAALRKRFEVLTENRESYSLYIFSEENKFRCACDWFVSQKWFDNVILLFIALNCITLAMERPNIPNNCPERYFLATANYVFTFVFTLEMFVKVSSTFFAFHPLNSVFYPVSFVVLRSINLKATEKSIISTHTHTPLNILFFPVFSLSIHFVFEPITGCCNQHVPWA